MNILRYRHIPSCYHLTKSSLRSHNGASQPHSKFPCVWCLRGCVCVFMLTSKRSLRAHLHPPLLNDLLKPNTGWGPSLVLSSGNATFPSASLGSPVCPHTVLFSVPHGWFPPWNELFPRYLGYERYPDICRRNSGILFLSVLSFLYSLWTLTLEKSWLLLLWGPVSCFLCSVTIGRSLSIYHTQFINILPTRKHLWKKPVILLSSLFKQQTIMKALGKQRVMSNYHVYFDHMS